MRIASLVARSLVLSSFALVVPTPSSGAARAPDPLLAKLRESKISLAEGIRQAQAAEGVAISAKFEMDGDALSLSIYTAKLGLSQDPEANVLEELAGDPTAAAWTPGIEVFDDKEHIARSAGQLTLMQLSEVTLEDAIASASAQVDGIVYSITPKVVNGRAVAEVLIADDDNDEGGASTTVEVDLQTGDVTTL